MALDTTVGGTNSDSYATLAEANAYHANRGSNSEWTSASDAEKEKHLKWAAQQLDVNFDFVGTKADPDQALAWPRLDVVDREGWQINSDVIPAALKRAQAEYAFQLMKEDWTQGLSSVRSEKTKIGNLEIGKETHNRVPDSVARLLINILDSGAGESGSVDLVRA